MHRGRTPPIWDTGRVRSSRITCIPRLRGRNFGINHGIADGGQPAESYHSRHIGCSLMRLELTIYREFQEVSYGMVVWKSPLNRSRQRGVPKAPPAHSKKHWGETQVAKVWEDYSRLMHRSRRLIEICRDAGGPSMITMIMATNGMVAHDRDSLGFTFSEYCSSNVGSVRVPYQSLI